MSIIYKNSKRIFMSLLVFAAFGISYGMAQDCNVASGTISTEDNTTICALDGVPDPIDVTVNGASGTNAAWIITDLQGIILGLPPGPPFDLEGAGEGTCIIWYMRYEGEVTGLEAGASINLLMGCLDLSNPIAVFRSVAEGGDIALLDGSTETTICALDGVSDAFDVTLSGNEGDNSAWIITDADLNVLGTPPGPPFDLEGAGAGTCLIWHISYADGVDINVGNAADLEGCYDLSNAITVYRDVAEGGDIALLDGSTETTICALDGVSDAFDVTLSGNEGDNSAWIITDADLNVLGTPPGPPFDLEGAGAGTCLIWHISYADGVDINVGNAADLEGCYDLSNAITVYRDVAEGGDIALLDGSTETTICALDGVSDAFDVTLSGNQGDNSAWIITDADLNVLGTPPGPPFDLEGAGAGTCLIWHLSYADGVDINVGNAADLEGCYDLSNPITVVRNTGEDCQEACAAPISSSAEVINSRTAAVDWNDVQDADFYVIRYRPEGKRNWRYRIAADSEITLNRLKRNSTYEYQIATYCYGEGLSDYSLSFYFDLSAGHYSATDSAITVEQIGEIEEDLSLRVYPNPAANYFTLEYDVLEENASVRIYNVNGEIVLEQELGGGNGRSEIDISRLQSGQFIVVLDNNGERKVEKLIKR